MTRLRLAFMGSPDFSVPSLAALIHAGHDIVRVYAQPPRPAGRGHRERACPVHAFAIESGLVVATPATLKDPSAQAAFTALGLDAAVVVAYGLILPEPVLAAPRLGCLNVHASLLPRWRGAAPIQRAMLAGDAETGITIMGMDAGLDTGPIHLQEATPITGTTTAAALHDRLAEMGARMIVDALADIAAGALPARPQPVDGVTYAEKLRRDEARIDWTRSAVELERSVRALNPWPGVWFEHAGERIKVLAATAIDGDGDAGGLVETPLTVACGEGRLRIDRLQRPGKGPMAAADFVRGYDLALGARLK